jgi:N-glycosylase/DNA lyase
MYSLPNSLLESYSKYQDIILRRLDEFKNVKAELVFYEFCFCILTPQSSAANAIEVQKKLIESDFLNFPYDTSLLLSNKEHYIRFHNTKSQRLLNAVNFYPILKQILVSEKSKYEKRKFIKDNFSGIGMKEASHFLRNIGYTNLAIIDRHILKNLIECKVIQNISFPPTTEKKYLDIEQKFYNFSVEIEIPMDVLDLLIKIKQ